MLQLGSDLGLDFGVLRHGFDDDVRVAQQLVICRCDDEVQRFLHFLSCQTTAFHLFLQVGHGVLLALFGQLLADVDEHDLNADFGSGERNRCAHHAATDHAHFFAVKLRNALRAEFQLVGFFFVHKQSANHGAAWR